MASSKEYLEFILGQLSELEEITYRAMMGEFIIYYRGKIVGGIYDDRLLVKPVKAAISYMPTAPYELPYEGAKHISDNPDYMWNIHNNLPDWNDLSFFRLWQYSIFFLALSAACDYTSAHHNQHSKSFRSEH